jgi:hypothetical protein
VARILRGLGAVHLRGNGDRMVLDAEQGAGPGMGQRPPHRTRVRPRPGACPKSIASSG